MRLPVIVGFALGVASLATSAAAEESIFQRLERYLTALGYDAAPIDGLPDEGLKKAIVEYKQQRGLDPSTPLTMDEFERMAIEAGDRGPSAADTASDETATEPPSPTGETPGFCDTRTTDFLADLEGTWRLSHGPGFALFGGMGRQDFPAPAPITLTFTAWSNVGVGILSGDRQNLFMLPTSAQGTADHLATLAPTTEVRRLMPANPPCGWEDLPAMIGTNTYRLEGDGGRELTLNEIDPRDIGNRFANRFALVLCSETGTYDALADAVPDDFVPRWRFDSRRGEDFRGDPTRRDRVELIVVGDDRACRPPMTSADGDMDMTLILKFSSPRAATGIVSFHGRMQGMGLASNGGNLGIGFYAQTPVTMSR